MNRAATLGCVAGAAALLAGCNFSTERTDKDDAIPVAGDEGAEPATPDITPVDDTRTRAEGVVANGLVVADYDALTLGPRIVGPVGATVDASLATPLAAIGDIESWVACPATLSTDLAGDKAGTLSACEPGNLPKGTVFTYVHSVAPGIDRPNDRPFAQPEAIDAVKEVTAFRVAVPLTGFTGKAGYSISDARKALGPDAKFTVQCLAKAIVYSVEGSNKAWRKGVAIRFFWQSTAAPAGPAPGYELAADGKRGQGSGPAPAKPAEGEGPLANVPCA